MLRWPMGHWGTGALGHWIAHGEYAPTTELPRRLARVAAAPEGLAP